MIARREAEKKALEKVHGLMGSYSASLVGPHRILLIYFFLNIYMFFAEIMKWSILDFKYYFEALS